MVMVPWQTPPQSKRLCGEVELAGDLAGEPPVLGVGVDSVQGLVKAQDPLGPDVAQEPHHRPGLGLRRRRADRTRRSRPGRPTGRGSSGSGRRRGRSCACCGRCRPGCTSGTTHRSIPRIGRPSRSEKRICRVAGSSPCMLEISSTLGWPAWPRWKALIARPRTTCRSSGSRRPRPVAALVAAAVAGAPPAVEPGTATRARAAGTSSRESGPGALEVGANRYTASRSGRRR